jgi:hypothetical protein
MRSKLTGFVVAVLMVMAMGGLTAPPSFATDYFVKHNHLSTSATCTPPGTGPLRGTTVFKRTATSMSATMYLRNGPPNTQLMFLIAFLPSCGYNSVHIVTTDGDGNATVPLGTLPRKGNKSFFSFASHPSLTCPCFESEEAPAFGF